MLFSLEIDIYKKLFHSIQKRKGQGFAKTYQSSVVAVIKYGRQTVITLSILLIS